MLITPKSTNVKHEAPYTPRKSNWNGFIYTHEFIAELAALARRMIGAYGAPDVLSDSELANFQDTPMRAVKGWLELFDRGPFNQPDLPIVSYLRLRTSGVPEGRTAEAQELAVLLKQSRDDFVRTSITPKATLIYSTLPSILETGFPMESTTHDPGLVTQGAIRVKSMCPHHLLPVDYEAFVSYLPKKGGLVLGLSKLARLSQALGHRPILQEQLTNDIADVLFHNPSSESVFPQIETEGSAVQLIGRHTCMSCRGVHSDALTLTTSLRGAYSSNDRVKSEFYQSIKSIRASLLNVKDEAK